jgi:tight adherence protein B
VLAVAGFAVWRVVGAAIAVGAWGLARRLGGRRSRRAVAARRDEQLADAVGALTSAVRAGLSLPQALAYAAREAEPPFADDLDALVGSLDAGVPMADAVTAWVERVGTDDARLVGAVLELHRRSGGDLPAVLDQVAATIRERVAAAREVRALTAQARLSGLILGLLPIGFFAFLWLTSRREIEGALSTPAGVASIAIGLGLELGAFVWIRRLLEVA